MSADGSIIIDTDIDDKNAQQKLNRINKKIQSLENQLASKKQGKLPLEENLNSVNTKLQEAQKRLSMLKEEQSAINAAMSPGASPDDYLRAYSDKDRVNAALKQQQAEVDAIEKEWKQADRALSSYNSKISGLESKLNQAKVEAGGIYQQVSRTVPDTNKMAKSVDRAQKSAAKFSMRLREVIRSALVFTIITQALAKFREWMGKVIKTNDEARAAIARLKGALLTLAQPLIEVIIPAFTKFVDILARIIAMAARFTAALFGTTAEKAADSAENLYEETEAIEGTGEAAEKAEKSLASFDEINQLAGGDKKKEENKKEDKLEEPIEPDFSIVKNKVQDALSSILELLTGAALLALGAILVFTGASIPLGLALMVAGALAIADAITSNPEAIKTLLQGGLGEALSIIGPLVAVIGVLLVVTGHILLGIALIILGATIWAVGTASGDEGDFVQNIITRLQEAAEAIGPWIAIIGIVLLVAGQIPLGIGLIVLGIAIFALGKMDMDGGESLIDTIVSALSAAMVEISPYIAIIGLVLILVPGMQAIGIALLIAGIGLFIAGTAMAASNDNEMKSWVEVLQLDKVEQWVSTALLLAGIALVAIGAMTLNPLFLLAGIALLGGGVALKALNSGSVKTGGGSFSAGSGAGRMSAPKLALADVPMLAKGAVIPPNREFLAVLGDQKRGTNIEAPTSEIEAAVARGIQRSGMGSGSGDRTTILQIGEQEMARVVYRLNNQQTQRIGVRLAED